VLFNSLEFLWFLIIVILVVFIMSKFRLAPKYVLFFLLGASYYFYYVSSGTYILVFFVYCALNFYLGRVLYSSKNYAKKSFLFLFLFFNIGLLVFFKYINVVVFLINWVQALFSFNSKLPLLNFVLPLGISFYTFEAISYGVDIYTGRIKPEQSFVKFLFFMAFFPKFIAGPIMRAKEFFPQLLRDTFFDFSSFKFSATLILFGLFKKIVIADNIALFVTAMLDGSFLVSSSFGIWVVMFAFAIQIYCDFSGYSDIAIGVAKFFGIDLVQNFNRPFFSKNPAEFWRRWNISLSFWIRDYIYYPLYFFLSGTKLAMLVGSVERRTKIIVYFANFVAMFFMGIWHGPSINYVIYGAYYGILLVAYHLIADVRKKLAFRAKFPFPKIAEILSICLTLYFIVLGFLIFRVNDLLKLKHLLGKYLSFDLRSLFCDLAMMQNIISEQFGVVVAIFIFVAFEISDYFFKEDLKKFCSSLGLFKWCVLVFVLILLMFVFLPSKSAVFIYFQF